MTGQAMRQILLQAGVRFTEAAQLFQIDRSTLYHWFDGIMPKNKFLYVNAEQIVSKIQRAMRTGELPLQGTTGKERLPVIAAILKKY